MAANVEISYLEFYSGIGGWSFALQEAITALNVSCHQDHRDHRGSYSMKCLGAYDNSDLCNSVFEYNFSSTQTFAPIENHNSSSKRRKIHQSRSIKKVSIEYLSKEQLEEKRAMIWLMSPPCQPHTRQHNNQNLDTNDIRSKSFLHLCDLISNMDEEALPYVILLENVVGFEKVSTPTRYHFMI